MWCEQIFGLFITQRNIRTPQEGLGDASKLCSFAGCLHQKLRGISKSFFQESKVIAARMILIFRAVSDVNNQK